jgi:hypothetical protein
MKERTSKYYTNNKKSHYLEQNNTYNPFLDTSSSKGITQEKENPFFDKPIINPFFDKPATNPFFTQPMNSQSTMQKQGIEDGKVQMKQANTQKKENNTDLLDNIKSGIGNISAYSTDNVKVHHNSSQPTQLQAHATQSTLQMKCSACENEEEAIQRATIMTPIQLKGTKEQCEGYHADYKKKLPKKCTQNNTKVEMEANVIATQEHIDGRELYINEECDDVLPGSIAKGSDVALMSHQAELNSVKKTLATCNDKIKNGKYKI